ncbi:alpha/beta fold hydrolase [Serratia odorifera]|jgi:N-formylmaleamate deformylase|uniref:Hydrolase, alpha/beta domain protein n=2 Tax=Serratia odorifera TaxID=618 RepID=D4E6K6_SEROD|nr:alpha/beta hydrolase [Serratia odorifera]EFE94572.1 hydrolase, alpha/beta domain protein [Serratia odorifera DSM 4582]PNK89381.1 alpha/beta hydrolase [Serratia odorifera]RII70374.1 alpha/beta hydrolase [Serratia odorifera]VDZ63475.1 Tropinesterase [Serratia odorifera]HEJ9093608.1 alpha/beta hydrolase [Serratia odorifera]
MSTYLYGAQLQANGIRQHYLRYGGSGPALILIPGITSPAITWGFVAERLGERYDTYVLDVRGRGLSASGPDLAYDAETCAQDVTAFATALGLSRYSLLGHSMGARFALRAAAQHPQGVQRVVLVDPPVSGPGRRAYPGKWPWYADSIRAAEAGISAEQMRAYCPTWSEEQRQLRAEWLHTCYEPAIERAYTDFHQVDSHQDYPRLTMPTLLMVAGKGEVILPEDRAEICALQPEISVVVVENAGHMIPWDDEEGFFQALGDFLG